MTSPYVNPVARRHREPVLLQPARTDGDERPQHGGRRRHERQAHRERLRLSRRKHEARDRQSLGKLVQEHGEEQQRTESRRHHESARDRDSVEEGMQ